MSDSVFDTFDESRKALMQKRRDLLVAIEKVVINFHCAFFHAVQTKPVVSDVSGVYIEGFGVSKNGGRGWSLYAETSCGTRLFINAEKGNLVNAGGPKLRVKGGMVIRAFLEQVDGFLGAIKPSLESHLSGEAELINHAEQALASFVTRNSLEVTEGE